MSHTLRLLSFGRRLAGARSAWRTPLSTAPKLNIRQSYHAEIFPSRLFSTVTASTDPYHSIIRDNEKVIGDADKHEFQAETRMLLDIVAKSLYSEKEVFLRELISNASDALEKFRYVIHNAGEKQSDYVEADRGLEIHIATNKQERILTIQDTGIGMTKEELVSNLGTIARSGSKQFMEQLKEADAKAENIIGQFGVGFYSAFMVADKLEVFTRSSKDGAIGYKWTSDGSGMYEIVEADGVAVGTKIVIHLKQDCREYADEQRVRDVIRKYSNFVGSPIFLNGHKANQIQPLWLMEPKEVTKEQHDEFYRFVGNTFDIPRFVLHYKADVPLSIRSVLYFPEGKPGLFDMSREGEMGVALYTRKVLIQSKTENLLPKWLRFIKGVVDSEDIPLNLSRELLQNSALIARLRNVLTNRVLRFLHDRSTKQPEEYEKFYKDYGLFLKEGIVTGTDQKEKEEIGKLLRFESSKHHPSTKVSLPEYCNRLKEDQKDVYYLAAPNRILAEASPYFEALKKKDIEVLFCYEPYDELVLMQLGMFLNHNLISVEKEMRRDKTSEDEALTSEGSLLKTQADDVIAFFRSKLAGKCANVKVTNKLDKYPCVITVEEMGAARHFIKTQGHQMLEENRYALLQPQLEINPRHAIIRKLHKLIQNEPELAEMLAQQLFFNSMVQAGLTDDPRTLLTGLNDLLEKILEKH